MPTPTIQDVSALARMAGAILRQNYGNQHNVEYKSAIDLVTEVDYQSEAVLIAEIKRQFPGTGIMAEESGDHGDDSQGLWYLDPIDGTVNYAHGVPVFCVSVAYAQGGQILLGAVYDPMRDEMFSAGRGEGAFLNGQPIHATAVDQLSQALLVTGFPYHVRESGMNLNNFVRFMGKAQSVRRLGSAALDLCYTAAGRFDGYWELALNPWDMAAGALIAEEAGALITAADGARDYLRQPCSVIAANPVLHQQIFDFLHEGDK